MQIHLPVYCSVASLSLLQVLVTETENSWGWKGPLQVECSPIAQSTVSQSRLLMDRFTGFCVSPRKEIQGFSISILVCSCPFSKKVFLCPLKEFPVLQFCTLPPVFSLDTILSLSSFLPNHPIRYFVHIDKIPPEPFLSLTEWYQHSQSLLVFQMLLSLNHLWSFAGPAPYVHVSLVLWYQVYSEIFR